jgi:formamidopyrimidine-DNA glycosylase
MPELPEVQTTVNGLKSKALNRAFVGVWSDWKKVVKKPVSWEFFEKEIRNKKIKKIWRRAKNVIFDLSDGYSLLVHQKMTGHLLLGNWEQKEKTWIPAKDGYLKDPYNRFIHLMFWLSDGLMMGLSDARKFAKVELWKTEDLKKELDKLGPEPLEKSFTFEKFKQALQKKKSGRIKQVLMDPAVIAGIGNIYSSESLWRAKIHPEKNVAKLSEKELKSLYQAIIKVLDLAIKCGGESFSDYRKPDGSKGGFDDERKAYWRDGEKCLRCHKAVIKRISFGGRSAFYCPNCQKIK